jgi:hypothetical protein
MGEGGNAEGAAEAQGLHARLSLLQDSLPLEDSRPSQAAWMWWLVEFLGSLWATIWVVELGMVLILAPDILVFLLPRWGRLAVSSQPSRAGRQFSECGIRAASLTWG